MMREPIPHATFNVSDIPPEGLRLALHLLVRTPAAGKAQGSGTRVGAPGTREILILIQPFKHTVPSGFLIHL